MTPREEYTLRWLSALAVVAETHSLVLPAEDERLKLAWAMAFDGPPQP